MDEDITIERDGREEDSMSEEDLEASESRADAKADKLKKELETVKRERQEYLDGWQRAKADYVNALKRFDDEKKAVASQSTMKAIRALIPVLDSLERAKAQGELPPGFDAIAKQLEQAFGSFDMRPIGAVGEAFNPSLHEALGTDPTDDPKQDDTVSAVLEVGYQVGEAVLRPAKVRAYHHEG